MSPGDTLRGLCAECLGALLVYDHAAEELVDCPACCGAGVDDEEAGDE